MISSKDEKVLENGEKLSKCTISDIDKTVGEVLRILRNIRVGITFDEYELQHLIAELLEKSNIHFKKEYKLAARNRIDFLVEGGIGIEVKKGKPNRAQVSRQLERYAAFSEVKAVILVVERSVNISSDVNGKKCILFGLNRLWGVALG